MRKMVEEKKQIENNLDTFGGNNNYLDRCVCVVYTCDVMLLDKSSDL